MQQCRCSPMFANAHISSLGYLCCYRACVKLNSGHVPALLAQQYTKIHPLMFHNIFGGGRGKGDFESALSCTPPNRFLYYMGAMHSWTRVLLWSPSHVVFNCCLSYWFYMVAAIGVREIFCQGGGVGAVNHLPKKFSQVSQIFTKESKRNEGHIATT